MDFKVRGLSAVAAVATLSLSGCDVDPIRPRSNHAPTQAQQATAQDGDVLTGFSATLTVRTWEEDVPPANSKGGLPVNFRVTSVRQATGTWKFEVSILGEGRGSAIRTVMVPGDGSPVRYLDERGNPVRLPATATTFPGIPVQQSAGKGPVLRDGWHEAFIIAFADQEALAAKRQRIYAQRRPRDAHHDEYVADLSDGNRVEEVVDRQTSAPTERSVYRNGVLQARTSFETTTLPAGGGYLIASARTVYQSSKHVLERTLSNVTTNFAPRQ